MRFKSRVYFARIAICSNSPQYLERMNHGTRSFVLAPRGAYPAYHSVFNLLQLVACFFGKYIVAGEPTRPGCALGLPDNNFPQGSAPLGEISIWQRKRAGFDEAKPALLPMSLQGGPEETLRPYFQIGLPRSISDSLVKPPTPAPTAPPTTAPVTGEPRIAPPTAPVAAPIPAPERARSPGLFPQAAKPSIAIPAASVMSFMINLRCNGAWARTLANAP